MTVTVPQMADAEEVAAAIVRREGTELSGLVLNEQGFERLRATGLDGVNCTLAATESFSRRSANDSVDEAPARGADEIVPADTIGVVTPGAVRLLAERAAGLGRPLGHGHDTRHTGVACAAVEAGASALGASVGRLGGCPFAPRATGNVATEDVVYLLEREGVDTGVDLDTLIATAEWREGVLGRRLPGRVYRPGPFPAAQRP